MGIVVGISWMYSARILGYAKSFPLDGFERLFGLAWFGFAINAASGVLLFVGEPRRLAATPAFWVKMVLIVCAGLSLWALEKALHGMDDIDALPGPAGAVAREVVGDGRRQDRRDRVDRVLARRHHRRPDHRLHHAAAAAVRGRDMNEEKFSSGSRTCRSARRCARAAGCSRSARRCTSSACA